jgi:hypothetical protein
MSDIKMKKVLILAYDFPPYVSVGGLRPYNWYRYLKEFGIEPIVITRQWSNTHGNYLDYISGGQSKNLLIEKDEYGTILRSPYKQNISNKLLLKYGTKRFKIIRKTISAFIEFAQFIFPCGPKIEIYKAGKSFLKENKIDCIIATGDPFILFKYASKLSREFNIPWIADYRDPWSHNQENQKSFILKTFMAWNEKRIVHSASHIITVSTFVSSKIESLVKNVKFTILPNGFDPEVIDTTKNIKQGSNQLTIGFVGTIYNWHPIETFLKSVQKHIESNPKSTLRLHFYGINIQNELSLKIKKDFPMLFERITIFPKMSNKDLIEKLKVDNVMLLFNYYSYMGTKIFDYLGIERKMILCFENDSEANELKRKFYLIKESENESNQLQANLIQSTNSGVIVKDANHLLDVLGELHQEFENTGSIACNSHGIEKYSRKIQVEKLAELLASIQPLASLHR